ncbi:hypothetical protein ODJ79_14280 [Actinoplanes sp. KI2]|uniref:hypothetical protein n=1 Tax=Actinoplanes sp. KI2 TaxID=2983315 RepID=UPI0021D5DD51|nr:hypothetical protein [Actinoplanes sp. KI2]MCU7724890.1 hypothetical protein [Actinoplanes sp. KI2]
MSATTKSRAPGTRRAGYVIALLVNTLLIYLINVWPGWAVLPFLTSDMTQVLPVVNLSLMAGIAVNLVYLAYDAPWVVAAGGLVTTGVGLAAIVRLWRVFPFDLATGSAWTTVIRVLLLVAMAGSVIGIVVQVATPLGDLLKRRLG